MFLEKKSVVMKLARPDGNDGQSKAAVGQLMLCGDCGWMVTAPTDTSTIRPTGAAVEPWQDALQPRSFGSGVETRTVLVFRFKIRVFDRRGIYWAS